MKKANKKQPYYNTKQISKKASVNNKVVKSNDNTNVKKSQDLYVGIEGELEMGYVNEFNNIINDGYNCFTDNTDFYQDQEDMYFDQVINRINKIITEVQPTGTQIDEKLPEDVLEAMYRAYSEEDRDVEYSEVLCCDCFNKEDCDNSLDNDDDQCDAFISEYDCQKFMDTMRNIDNE